MQLKNILDDHFVCFYYMCNIYISHSEFHFCSQIYQYFFYEVFFLMDV